MAEAAFFLRREAAASRAKQRATNDAQSTATSLTNIAACPRCGRRKRGLLVGAAIYDFCMHFLAITIFLGLALAVGSLLLFGPNTHPPLVVALVTAIIVGTWRGARKLRKTIDEAQIAADANVLWMFCMTCEKKISKDVAWSTCEHCGRAIHDECGPAHAISHRPAAVYR